MSDHVPLYNSETLLCRLREQGHAFSLFHHVPVFTVEEAEQVSADIPGLHTRNLFLRDKKERMFLITLRHDTPIDLKKLSDMLGVERFSFGSPDRLWTCLGVTPGSVTPLSILNDQSGQVQLILEDEMMKGDIINMHPLINSMSISLSPQVLMTILQNHAITARVMDLKEAAPDL